MKNSIELKELISEGRIREVIDHLEKEDLIHKHDYLKNKLSLITTRWNQWNRFNTMGLGPADSEKNKITYNLLLFVDEIKGKKESTSTSVQELKIEHNLSFLLSRLQEVEKRRSSDLLLKFLEDRFSKETSTMFFLDYKRARRQSRRKNAFTVDDDNQLNNTIKTFQEKLVKNILDTPGLPPEIIQHLDNVLRKEMSLLEMKRNALHQEAYIKYLTNRVGARERQLKFYKSCASLGVIGLFAYNVWSKSNENQQDKLDHQFDENGYDENGLNPDGFKQNDPSNAYSEIIELEGVFDKNNRLPILSSYMETSLELMDNDLENNTSFDDDFENLTDHSSSIDDLT